MIDKTKLAKLLRDLEKLKAVKDGGALGGLLFDLANKLEGLKGEKGDTPLRGLDYWTDKDIKEIIDEAVRRVRALIPSPKDGKNGRDGNDGIRGRDGRDGVDGKDGESADIASVIREVEKALTPLLPKIEEIENKLPMLGKPIRDALEILPEDEKLKIEAIENLRKELDDLKKRPISVGGGGFNYGALDLHIIDDETPTGTPNGALTTFTINHAPSPVSSLKVYVDGQRKKLTTDYTFSGTTITFLSAPLTDSIITVEYRI